MPFLSETQLARVQDTVQKLKAKAANAGKKAVKSQKASEVKSTIECVGAAGAMGFLRGKLEDDAGVWNLPFVGIDAELTAGTLLIGGALFDLFGKYDEDVLSMGQGVMAHYVGQVMRKMSKSGKAEGRFLGSFSQVAGTGPAHRGLPQARTQMSSRHADPVAQALAAQGY